MGKRSACEVFLVYRDAPLPRKWGHPVLGQACLQSSFLWDSLPTTLAQ